MVVLLREMTEHDLELVMSWRNNEKIWQGFYTQKQPLMWREHQDYWKTRRNWKAWIIQVSEGGFDELSGATRDVGQVNVGQLDSWYPDVGILIGETTLWGQGVGKRALELVIAWLKEKEYQRARASILEDNIRSQKLFESVGFKRLGQARKGELLYDKDLTIS